MEWLATCVPSLRSCVHWDELSKWPSHPGQSSLNRHQEKVMGSKSGHVILNTSSNKYRLVYKNIWIHILNMLKCIGNRTFTATKHQILLNVQETGPILWPNTRSSKCMGNRPCTVTKYPILPNVWETGYVLPPNTSKCMANRFCTATKYL